MICPDCEGTGRHVFDDDEAVPCLRCNGKGRSSIWFDFRLWLGVRIDMQIEHLRFTRLGKWYWRRWGMERRARALARGRTAFALAAMAGRSLERMREFATHIENGVPIERQYQIEIRLQAELARACELRPIGGWSRV